MTRSTTTPTPAELIADLRDLGMQLWADDGQLRFRAPRGVLTPERREQLTANREAVLACLDAETATVTPDPEHQHDPFPLTDVQLAYLLGRRDAFDYGDVPCQVYAEMEYQSLDPARLEEAWNLLVRRHGMLRASFDLDGYQQVRPEVPGTGSR